MAHFGGTDAAAAPVTLHAPASTAAFASCTFAGNLVGDRSSGVIAAHARSAVQLQDCAFSNNSGPGYILANPDGEAAFYSDTESVRGLDNRDAISGSATLLPLSASASAGLFLSEADGWFADNSQVRWTAPTPHHSHGTAMRRSAHAFCLCDRFAGYSSTVASSSVTTEHTWGCGVGAVSHGCPEPTQAAATHPLF